MNDISVFNFNSNEVRTVVDESNLIWFLANDLTKALGYKNPRQALASHVDAEDVQKLDTLTNGIKQSVNYVNESGMYSLVLRSKKEEAKQFKRWVTSEVLPSIRKTGTYSAPEKNPHLQLSKAIKKACGSNRKCYSKCYRALYDRFQVVSYKEIPANQISTAIEFIETLEGELLPLTEPTLPAGCELPPEQAHEINQRLNRVMSIFHPFSDPFQDLLGIGRLLRGCAPNTGLPVSNYKSPLPKH